MTWNDQGSFSEWTFIPKNKGKDVDPLEELLLNHDSDKLEALGLDILCSLQKSPSEGTQKSDSPSFKRRPEDLAQIEHEGIMRHVEEVDVLCTDLARDFFYFNQCQESGKGGDDTSTYHSVSVGGSGSESPEKRAPEYRLNQSNSVRLSLPPPRSSSKSRPGSRANSRPGSRRTSRDPRRSSKTPRRSSKDPRRSSKDQRRSSKDPRRRASRDNRKGDPGKHSEFHLIGSDSETPSDSVFTDESDDIESEEEFTPNARSKSLFFPNKIDSEGRDVGRAASLYPMGRPLLRRRRSLIDQLPRQLSMVNFEDLHEDDDDETYVSSKLELAEGDELCEEDFQGWDYKTAIGNWGMNSFPNAKVERQFRREFETAHAWVLHAYFLLCTALAILAIPFYSQVVALNDFPSHVMFVRLLKIAYCILFYVLYACRLLDSHLRLSLVLYIIGHIGFYASISNFGSEPIAFGFMFAVWGFNLFCPVGGLYQLTITSMISIFYLLAIVYYNTVGGMHGVLRTNHGLALSSVLQIRYINFISLVITNIIVIRESRVHECSYRSYFYKQHRLRFNRGKSGTLLDKVLPKYVSKKLKCGERISIRSKKVTVLFCKVSDFEEMAMTNHPKPLVRFLNELFTYWDYLTERNKVYKVETVGPVFMVASGILPESSVYTPAQNAARMADLALDMNNTPLLKRFVLNGKHASIKLGLNVGPVIAGVIGRLLPRFRLIGSAVNKASRMQSTAEKGMIQCSMEFYKLISSLGRDYVFFKRKEPIFLKGLGMQDTYVLSFGPVRTAGYQRRYS